MKKNITLKSYAKINLSLDVGERRADGMHPVDTVMQAVDLFDVVKVEVGSDEATCDDGVDSAVSGGVDSPPSGSVTPPIELSVAGADLTRGPGNLAYKAAQLMINRYGNLIPDEHKAISISLEKNIPIAAGLAGGSGNASAVMLALNYLWGLGLSMEELLEVSALLGSDVPFCLMTQAVLNGEVLQGSTASSWIGHTQVSTCARAKGTGTQLEPLPLLEGAIILCKPDISLSTKEVYEGFDKCVVEKRPDNDAMASALKNGDRAGVIKEMINLLELHSLKVEDVNNLKEAMEQTLGAEKVLMSGSGPTVYALFPNMHAAEAAATAAKAASHGNLGGAHTCFVAKLL